MAAIASCTAVAATAPAAPAYDPTQFTNGRVYHWPTGTTIAVYIDPVGTGGTVDLTGATIAAMTVWKAALDGSQFAIRTAASAADADVIVHLNTAPRVVGLAGCDPPASDAGGVTFFCAASDSARTLPLLAGPTIGRVKMDISINPAATNATNTLRAIVVHEFGHALGIGGHSPDARDVMFPQPAVETPSQRDAITLRWLVRQRADLRL